MLSRLACIILLAWPSCALARDKTSWNERAAAKLEERTKAEARTVLAAVLRDDKIEMTPCLLDIHWSTRPVTVDIAQTYLGSSLNADVIASHLGVSPVDLIDAGDKMRGSACSDAHSDALWRQMVDDFRSGANPGERGADKGRSARSSTLRLRRAEITLPLFNRMFTTAAVVVGYNSLYTWKIDADASQQYSDKYDKAGYYRRQGVEGFGYTYVYRKKGGVWKRIHETDDWSAH